MDPVTVALVLAAGSAVGKGFFQFQSADTRRHALDLQMEENRLQFQQRTIANYDQVQRVLEAQQAQMTVRGVAFSSPSYKAIAGDTFNIGMKNQRNIELEQRINESNLEIEKKNVKKTLFAQLFGDVAEGAEFAFTAYNKLPKAGK